jgi:hypothetical protein
MDGCSSHRLGIPPQIHATINGSGFGATMIKRESPECKKSKDSRAIFCSCSFSSTFWNLNYGLGSIHATKIWIWDWKVDYGLIDEGSVGRLYV